ncbi:MAG TPA: septal ring lytic transglycosylase RlpA family protein [Ignavibacteria bacterium]|nr:septal ring lytic transglycosylase RlpA family protein [Ignavibacteria bacterium]
MNPISSLNEIVAKPSNDKIGFTQQGIASWYGPGFQGRKTANGERFNTHDLTAAHKTLPFNSMVKVTNLETGKSVIVKINDRGPYIKGRIIDLSHAAKTEIGMGGLADVMIEVLDPETLESVNSTETTSNVSLLETELPENTKVIIELTRDDEGLVSNNQFQDIEINELFDALEKLHIKVISPGADTSTLNLNANQELINLDITKKVKSLRGFTFLLGQFYTKEEAYELIGKLEANEFKTLMIKETIVDDSSVFNVYAGHYEYKNESRSDKRRLVRMNLDPMILRIGS